ncbi:hypothetical protein [Tsukamurella spumae]|uniref:Uncharacterized protein n=1 Tax=Tsukamurella spumae TaxID=44753 RepID=A0A846X238_9ACTN|nr:hypothetical protein [Tsukamurella spumae]NKY19677.1 hypothetical protein [Tsukamurella spumae]
MKLTRRPAILGSRTLARLRLRNRRLALLLTEDGERLVTSSDLRSLRVG